MKEEDTLIVIKGDKLSELVLKAIKEAGFDGNIITLSPDQVGDVGTGLPSLYVGNAHYGPMSLNTYLVQKKFDELF